MTVFKNTTSKDLTDTILVRCDCTSKEHEIEFGLLEEFNSVFFQVSLAKQSLFRRFIYAVKYIFGRQSDYGAFQEVLLNKEDVNYLLCELKKFHDQMK